MLRSLFRTFNGSITRSYRYLMPQSSFQPQQSCLVHFAIHEVDHCQQKAGGASCVGMGAEVDLSSTNHTDTYSQSQYQHQFDFSLALGRPPVKHQNIRAMEILGQDYLSPRAKHEDEEGKEGKR